VLTALADAAINTAVTTTPQPGTSFRRELRVNFLHPRDADGRDLVARTSVEQRGRPIAVATARIDDADGKRVAMAAGSAMISEGRLEERRWPPMT
jgi:acyl-coenzyme A thioesterase PaaI-like protein